LTKEGKSQEAGLEGEVGPGQASAENDLPSGGGVINLRINPMIELDFKSKKEIYEIRKSYVLQYPQLLNKLIEGEYSPSEAIFGAIEDNKAWYGIIGQSYYGPGDRLMDGPSEETRFIANPFLLVGLDSGVMLVVDGYDPHLPPIMIYPEPLSLVWSTDCSSATVKYNLNSFWQKHHRYHDPDIEERGLDLVGFNARDFGFNYLYVDPQKSQNAFSMQAGYQPAMIRLYIHCGGNCGYAGCCNNMSPEQPELRVKINSLPAVLYLKLWRNAPTSIEQSPDMVFIIKMV